MSFGRIEYSVSSFAQYWEEEDKPRPFPITKISCKFTETDDNRLLEIMGKKAAYFDGRNWYEGEFYIISNSPVGPITYMYESNPS